METLKPVFDAIQDIASVSSRIAKEKKILSYSKLPHFEKVILYTYDYNKKFNVTNVPFVKHEYEIELNTIFDYLDYLSTLNGATDELKNNLSILSSIDAETNTLVNKIINKDLKCGASISTFKKYFKSLPVFEIMTCQKNIPKFLKLTKNREYFWSVKKNGTRVHLTVLENSVESHLSRSGLEYPNFKIFDNDLIKLCKHIHEDFKIPYPIYIDGESINPDERFEGLMSQIHRKYDVNMDGFKLHIFDTPIKNKLFFERQELLENVFKKYGPFESIEQLKHIRCNYNEEQLKQLSRKIVEEGNPKIDEGIVIKIADSPYEYKEHSKYWCKVKPTDTLDLEVLGFYYGKPGTKNEDVVGGLIVDYKGVEVRVGTGLSDQQRIEFLDNLPAIIEVEYKEVTPDGSLREPVLKSIRTDKNITD